MDIKTLTGRCSLAALACAAILALSCGPASPSTPAGPSNGGSLTSKGEPATGLAEFGDLPKAKAPGALGGLQLPDTGDLLFAAFQKLPAQIGGKTFHDYFNNSPSSTRYLAAYGENGPFGYPLSIGAYDVGYMTHYVPKPQVAGDFDAKTGDWTAGQWVASVAKDAAPWDDDLACGDSITVQVWGRDGTLVWSSYVSRVKTSGFTDTGLPRYEVSYVTAWGAEAGVWVFTAEAGTAARRDAAVAAFAAAAGK